MGFITLNWLLTIVFCITCCLDPKWWDNRKNDGTIGKGFLQKKKSNKLIIYQKLERTGRFYLTFWVFTTSLTFWWEQIELFKRSLNCFHENDYLKHVIDSEIYIRIKVLFFSSLAVNIFLPAWMKKAASSLNMNCLIPSKCNYAEQIWYSTPGDFNKFLN